MVWNEYSKEESGTDKELLSKINDLETKLKIKDENEITFKKNNPTDLSRIIEIEGIEGNVGRNSDDIRVFGNVGLRVAIGYMGKNYKVSVGDSIAGGKVTMINALELVFINKDGEEKHYLIPKRRSDK